MTQGFVSFGMRTTLLIFILGLFALNSRGQEIQLAADLNTKLLDPVASYPRDFIEVGDKAYFTASSTDYSRGLYVTDGTESGTIRLLTLPYRVLGGKINEMVGYKGKLYFTIVNEKDDWLLYSSDGTVMGTTRFDGTKNTPKIYNLFVFKNELYFVGSGSVGKTDGTYFGTQWLKISKNVDNFCTLNGKLYFSALAPDTGQAFADRDYEIWESDGTASGSKPVSNFNPGGLSFFQKIVAHQDHLILEASTGNPKYLLKYKDGHITPYNLPSDSRSINIVAQTNAMLFVRVQRVDRQYDFLRISDDLNALEYLMSGSNFGPYGVQSGKLLFGASDSSHGHELWLTDGTKNGTRLLRDITPGPNNGVTNYVNNPWASVNNKTYFVQASTNYIWHTDGTNEGTMRLTDTIQASYLTKFGNGIIFTGSNTYGAEPWISDGTALGTRQLKNLAGDYISGSSNPHNLQRIEGLLYFIATGDSGMRLYRMDPKTLTVESLSTTDITNIKDYVVTKDFFYLQASRQEIRDQILIIDRSSGDTTWSNIKPLWGFVPMHLTAFKNKLIFTASDTVSGVEVYIADGATKKIGLAIDIDDTLDIENYRLGGQPYGYVVLGDRCLFTALQNRTDRYVYSTDGTSAGTFPIAHVGSSSMVKVGDYIYFTNYVDNTLYRTDGTQQHVVPIKRFEGTENNPVSLYLGTSGGKAVLHVQDQSTSTFYIIDPLNNDINLFFASDVQMQIPYVLGSSILMNPINPLGTGYIHTYNSVTKRQGYISKNSASPPSYIGTLDGSLYLLLRHVNEYILYKYVDGQDKLLQVSDTTQHTGITSGVEIGNRLFFRATTPTHGTELFYMESPNKFASSGLYVFPNPVQNYVQVVLNDWTPDQLDELKLVDVNGRVVYERKVTSDLTTINTTELSNGMYLIYVGGRKASKFIKF